MGPDLHFGAILDPWGMNFGTFLYFFQSRFRLHRPGAVARSSVVVRGVTVVTRRGPPFLKEVWIFWTF